MSFSAPVQLVFPFAPDPNYCSRCLGYTRINPRCLHAHKLSRLVLFTRCDKCVGLRFVADSPCPRCAGKGFFYEIVSAQEVKDNPRGRKMPDGKIEPYSNRL